MKALNEEFKPFLPEVIPPLLTALHSDKISSQTVAMKSLHCLVILGKYLEDYLYLVVPSIVRLFENNDSCIELKIESIKCLIKLSKKLNDSEYSSRIIQTLMRTLHINNVQLRKFIFQNIDCLNYSNGFRLYHFCSNG